MTRIFRLWWVVLGITLVIIGIGFHRVSEPVASIESSVSPSVTPTVSVPASVPSPHPVSLQAIAQKEYDGREFTVGPVLDDNTRYTRYYITYKSGELLISGIMNKPKGEGPFPLLILNHGYIDPGVYTNGRGLRREQDYLARRGYVVVHPDYRNHADSSKDSDNDYQFRLGYIDDVINAVIAIKAADLTYVNKEKVGMLGHSMGGGITLGILTSKPDLVNAAVLFAPVSASAKDNYDKYTVEDPALASQITERYGTPETNPEFWKNVSPEPFLQSVQVPVMVHHGTADESTPIAWSNSLVDKLRAAGKEVVYHVYPNEPHEFINAWPLVMERTINFFDRTL